MGFFSSSNNNITDEVDRATDENNSDENWEVIINICDKAGKSSDDAKAYLKAIIKRLYNSDPHISIQAVTLLDACVKNSGKQFHREIASRDFEVEYNKLLTKAHPKVVKKLKESLKRWSDNEFRTDPQLNLIPSLYHKLKNSGTDFSIEEMPVKKSSAVSKNPDAVNSQEEENDILMAIKLSLKESSASPRISGTSSSGGGGSLYPSTSLADTKTTTPAKEPKKVRALYDFEAAEDNELTFRSGEIIFVIDDSDANWWKGSNQRGEGLFPANFVTNDLEIEPEKFLIEKAKKNVQFKETINTKPLLDQIDLDKNVEIDENKINRLLHLMHDVDPTNPDADPEEMLQLEHEVSSMGPLVDAELEKVDRKHAQLTQLSADLVEALGLYHTLMRQQPQMPPLKMPSYGYGQMGGMSMPAHFNGIGAPVLMGQRPPQAMQSMGHLPPVQQYGPPMPPMMGLPPGQGQGLPPQQAASSSSGGPPHGMHLPSMHMMGPPPGITHSMTDDRRMQFPPGGPMVSGSFPSQTMLHNGPPQQTQSQFNISTSNVTNNPK